MDSPYLLYDGLALIETWSFNSPTPIAIRRKFDVLAVPQVTRGLYDSCAAVDFDSAWLPGIYSGQVINHQSRPPGGQDIRVLERPADVVPSDQEMLAIESEAHGRNIGLSFSRYCRNSGQPLRL